MLGLVHLEALLAEVVLQLDAVQAVVVHHQDASAVATGRHDPVASPRPAPAVPGQTVSGGSPADPPTRDGPPAARAAPPARHLAPPSPPHPPPRR